MGTLLRLILLLAALGQGLQAAQPHWREVEVENLAPVELRAFGGPDVVVAVRNIQMTTFTAVISDRRDLVPALVANGNGSFDTVMVPRGEGKVFKKEHGIPVDGRLSEAYLIYQDPPSGLEVYFYDTISKQNHYTLLIVPGHPPARAEPPAWEPEDPTVIEGTIVTLTDPVKLAALDPQGREIAPRYHKLIYWLIEGAESRLALDRMLADAFRTNGTDEVRATLATESLLAAVDKAYHIGWVTPENLDRMRRGHPGIVAGPKGDETLEVDRIVPMGRYPEFANELANLQLLPRSEREARAAQLDSASVDLLEKLRELPPLASYLAPPPATPPAAPPTPGWTVIDDTLLFKGHPLTTHLRAEATRWGLGREVYIQERVWAEQQKIYGAEGVQTYEDWAKERAAQRTAHEQEAVARLREAILGASRE